MTEKRVDNDKPSSKADSKSSLKWSKNKWAIIAASVLAGVLSIGLVWLLLSRAQPETGSNLQQNEVGANLGQGNLHIPPLLDYTEKDGVKNFSLTAQHGEYEFVPGVKSSTLGFNGDILSPTIRVSEGDNVNLAVNNKLSEKTTSHWHGAIVPGHADGGVHNIIESDKTWNARFKVQQQAATLWYHPHQHEETARQVYQGMGGFLLIDDENSRQMNIPQSYGKDDIPLIIQSKNLDSTGKLMPYSINQHQRINGFEGNTVLVNAQVKPTLGVSTNLVRLRLLNGSNSDLYTVSLSTGDEFYVIASDGGFYNKPVPVTSLEISNAKRYEVLVNASAHPGQTFTLDVNGQPQMTLNVNGELADKYEVPKIMNQVTALPYKGQVTRNFNLQLLTGPAMRGGGGVYGINGRLFDMERIDFTVQAGAQEYWRVTNIGSPGPGLTHPFHVHTTQFQVVEFNGQPPGVLQQGRHDTIALKANDTAVIAVPFATDTSGVFMYHCHILEHEDAGMMGQFKITDP